MFSSENTSRKSDNEVIELANAMRSMHDIGGIIDDSLPQINKLSQEKRVHLDAILRLAGLIFLVTLLKFSSESMNNQLLDVTVSMSLAIQFLLTALRSYEIFAKKSRIVSLMERIRYTLEAYNGSYSEEQEKLLFAADELESGSLYITPKVDNVLIE